MAKIPDEADRLLAAGRKKILRSCLVWGGPFLALSVLAGLQWAGAARLERYFAADPDKVDRRAIGLALAGLALFQFLCGAIGVLQGWAAMRRAAWLRQSMRRNHQGVPCPPHYSVKEDGSGLRIRCCWIWRRFTGAAMMCLLWNSFLVLWYWHALRSGGPGMWLAVIIGIPSVAVGLLLVYATLAGLLNRTVIRATSACLTVRQGPVPWWGNRRLPVDELERLYCHKDKDPKRQGQTDIYGVHALMKAAGKVDLVTDLDHPQALFIKQELERWLNTNDQVTTDVRRQRLGVTGARERCPACGAALGVTAGQLLGERRCPRCGVDLWMLALSRGPVFFPRRPGESLAELLIALAEPAVGDDARELEAALQGADHLDLVEILLDVEDVLRARGY